MWAQTNHFTSLNLSVPLGKMGMMIEPSSSWDNFKQTWAVVSALPDTSQVTLPESPHLYLSHVQSETCTWCPSQACHHDSRKWPKCLEQHLGQGLFSCLLTSLSLIFMFHYLRLPTPNSRCIETELKWQSLICGSLDFKNMYLLSCLLLDLCIDIGEMF